MAGYYKLGKGLLAIGFCVKNQLTLELLVPKIRTSRLFYQSQLDFERLLVTDFCSNDFSEFLWHIYYINRDNT